MFVFVFLLFLFFFMRGACRKSSHTAYCEIQRFQLKTASSPFLDSREVARNSRARKNWSERAEGGLGRDLFSFISPRSSLAAL